MKIEIWSFNFLGKPFQVPVHFHPTKGEFVATIPDDIAHQLTGQGYESRQTGYSFNELKKAIQQMIDKRETELTEKEVTTKVIIYEVELSGCFEYRMNGRKRMFEPGTARNLGVNVGWRISYRSQIGKKEPEYRDERGNKEWVSDRREHPERVMEWTEQREAFFRNIDTRLQAMVLQLDRFFNKQSQKKVIAAIDVGGMLALPDKSPENKKGDSPSVG